MDSARRVHENVDNGATYTISQINTGALLQLMQQHCTELSADVQAGLSPEGMHMAVILAWYKQDAGFRPFLCLFSSKPRSMLFPPTTVARGD